MSNSPKPADELFNDHLDACARCRENPFGLCPLGHQLIAKAASELQAPGFSGDKDLGFSMGVFKKL